MCSRVYVASRQRNLSLCLCILRPSQFLCRPLRVPLSPEPRCPSPQLQVRRAEGSRLAAARGARNSRRTHQPPRRQQTRAAAVELQRSQSSATRPMRAWGGREYWRTPWLRRRGWSCTGPTGGGVTSDTIKVSADDGSLWQHWTMTVDYSGIRSWGWILIVVAADHRLWL